jgi:hypothetical protein
MPRPNADARRVWLLVWSIALLVRLSAALLLPNAEQDGYSYAETIAAWRANISAGAFHVVDLFGFWLPLFQFVSAIVDLAVHNALVSGKIVSSLAGAASCAVVFGLTKRLTHSLALATFAFALVLLSPLHLLYSASAMTDIPFAALTIAVVWFVARGRWMVAAIFAAAAELVRLEAWTFIFALPVLQLMLERRIAWKKMSILLLPPLMWLAISHAATGDWLGYFAKRQAYQNAFIDFHPTRRGFVAADLAFDLQNFALGADPIVFVSILIATTLSILHGRERRREIVAIGVCTLTMLLFLGVAYVSKRQPILLSRYALVFFMLGVPAFAVLLPLLPTFVRVIAIALCLYGFVRQYPIIPKVIADYHAQERIASALVQRIADARCFTDDPAVRVLSRLPTGRFRRTEITPASARANRDAFLQFLREQRVDYLVFIRTEDSLPAQFFPELGRSDKIDNDAFTFIAHAPSPFGPDVWLYRLR